MTRGSGGGGGGVDISGEAEIGGACRVWVDVPMGMHLWVGPKLAKARFAWRVVVNYSLRHVYLKLRSAGDRILSERELPEDY